MFNTSSFLKARWMPITISVLALVIALGGHGFTVFNTVSTTELNTKLDGLEAFKTRTENDDSARDKRIQLLQTELIRQRRVISELETTVRELKTSLAGKESSGSALPPGFEAAQERAKTEEALAANETNPQPNGVSQAFDDLVIQRMKPYWEAPPTRQGEKTDDEDLVVLHFKLRRDGRLTDVNIANTSGMIEFDNSVLKAALRMQSIPEVARMSDASFARVASFRLEFSPNMLK